MYQYFSKKMKVDKNFEKFINKKDKFFDIDLMLKIR